MRNLVLDLGNTSLKVALFEDKNFIKLHRFQTLVELASFVKNTHFDFSILCSVLNDHETNILLSQLDFKPHIFSENSLIPIQNHYESPKTLGKDRLANAVYSGVNCENSASLVIDLGTCIKFDFVSKEKLYLGGSISPGYAMRFSSLNKDTGKLPLISPEKFSCDLIGKNTKTSILSGVVNGIQAEVNEMIRLYEDEFLDLTIFITGGDSDKFDLKAKNTIFADKLITLKGLNEILLFNK